MNDSVAASMSPGRDTDGGGPQKFYGKYRATVMNNLDPLKIGRIQVLVPDVSGLTLSSWAMPCLPVGGILEYDYIPPLGA